MLSDEAKTQISAEEIYRQEVREELERKSNKRKKKSSGARIWAFLNTSLGIWFLTTIVIGFATWAFTNWQNNRYKEANNQQAIKQLDQEIALRLNHFNNTVNGLVGFRAFSSSLASLEKPTNNEFSINGYPEYENRGLS